MASEKEDGSSHRRRRGGRRMIRLYSLYDSKGIEVCEHIRLPEAREDDSDYEYVEPLDIECKVCGKVYSYLVAIN